VLDHDRRRLAELEDDTCGRIEVEQVGVRQFLALEHVGGSEPGRRLFRVPRRHLVRVLSVAQVTHLAQAERDSRRRSSRVAAPVS
jgi:hypothetical protein